MRKMKTFFTLLSCVLLLAVLAVMPNAVAALQDSHALGQTHTGQVQSIQLEIREDSSAMAGLALMSMLNGVIEVPDEVASMTREEATEAAFELLQPYVDAGLIEPFEVFYANVRCLLGQASDNTELNSIFWSVILICDEEGLLVIDTAIDDETGSLLRINVTDNFAPYMNDPEAILMPFAEIYFTGLGIDDYGDFATRDLNACGIRYRFGDTLYGEINVDLYVYSYGFYTEFFIAGGDGYETDKRATTPADFGSLDHSGSISPQIDGSSAGSAA